MNNGDGMVTLNIQNYLKSGLAVFDADGRRVGTIVASETGPGYMLVRPFPLAERTLFIPLHTITHIDPREVFVAGTRAEMHRLYRDPPPHSTLLRERTDPLTGEDDSEAITTEPGGYDGTPVVIQDVPVGRLARDIVPGFQVVSSQLEILGTIAEDDAPRGEMLIRHPFPSRHVSMLSTAFVDFIDREDRLVYLTVSAADLRRVPAVAVEKES